MKCWQIHLLVHSFVVFVIESCIDSFIRLSIHAFIQSMIGSTNVFMEGWIHACNCLFITHTTFMEVFTYSFMKRSWIYALIHGTSRSSYMELFIHPWNYLFYWIVHSCMDIPITVWMYSLMHGIKHFTRSCTCIFIHVMSYWFIHGFIHLFIPCPKTLMLRVRVLSSLLLFVPPLHIE